MMLKTMMAPKTTVGAGAVRGKGEQTVSQRLGAEESNHGHEIGGSRTY